MDLINAGRIILKVQDRATKCFLFISQESIISAMVNNWLCIFKAIDDFYTPDDNDMVTTRIDFVSAALQADRTVFKHR